MSKPRPHPQSRLNARRARVPSQAARALIVLGATTLLCFMLVVDIVTVPGRVTEDFKSFYLAGAAAEADRPLYDPAGLRALGAARGLSEPIHPYLYPPPLAYALIPLATLPPRAAQIVWWGVGLAALGLALGAFALRLGERAGLNKGARAPRRDDESGPLLMAVLLLWLLNVRANAHWGQVNPLVTALVLLGFRAGLRREDFRAGAFLGLAAAVKVTPAIFVLFFLVRGRWRGIAGLAAALVATFLLTLPFGAWPAWRGFVDHLGTMSHGAHIPGLFPADSIANFSIAGFFSRLMGGVGLVGLASRAAILALLAPIVILLRRAPRDRAALVLLAPLSVVMVIASPLAYAHHVLFLLPGALILLQHAAREEGVAHVALLVALFALAGTDFPAYYHRFEYGPVLGRVATSLNLYVLLGFYAHGLVLARRAIGAIGARRGASALPLLARRAQGKRSGWVPMRLL